MSKIVNLLGQRFGCLQVIAMTEERCHGKVVWLCKCDCGNLHKVISNNLKNGSTVSCGCINKLHTSKGNYKHGLCKSRIYNIYICMKERCYNPNSTQFENYGGRGITVCDEWLSDFMNFYNWAMTNGYSDKLSIDRINNNGNYEPINCRWATEHIQKNNTSRNRFIEYKGEKHTVSEWARIRGINRTTLNARLNRGLPLKVVLGFD